jgi:hypothetical protein
MSCASVLASCMANLLYAHYPVTCLLARLVSYQVFIRADNASWIGRLLTARIRSWKQIIRNNTIQKRFDVILACA